MATLLISYLTVIFVASAWALPPVDVARNRPIDAQITCGALGVETFVSQKWQWSGGDVRENRTETCFDATTHPPSAMVDGDDSTYWQSTARPNFNQAPQAPEVVITIDLQQVFEIQKCTLLMGESLRPRRIVISKSLDNAAFVQPWIYRVQTELNCTRLYNTPSGTTNVVSLDSKLCQVYLTGPQPLNELIIFDLTPVTVPNWRFARFLKIEFFDIDLTLGIVGIPFQHYTVRTLNVMAECTCNGQQIDCSQSNITGTFECVCGNNTQGLNCETCLPFFNQYAYQSSTGCQPCNCYNHSEVCIFDQNVANTLGSLNARGERSGGGVCQNCRDNTAGVNCELCLPLSYRPVGVPQTTANPCVPCNCSGPGMQITGLIGECVMNAELTTNGMMPGDCRCKSNVVGRLCDRCRDGSYDMSPANPDGCQNCSCNTNGTIAGSIACNATGQCVCKRFVMNKQCDTCVDGYYGLDGTKLDGCTPCKCDVGGSLPSGCSKDVGSCTCRPGVTGQNCDTPVSGYYYPDLHFIFADVENIRAPFDKAQQGFLGFGYVTMVPQRPVSATVTPPYMSTFSNQFQMVMRYSAGTAGSGTVSIAGLADGITTASLNMTFPACPPPQWCYAPLGVLSLPQGFGSTISITVQGATDPRLLVDRLIAVPVEYLNTTNLFPDDATFQSTCNVIKNGVDAAAVYCKPKVFSLSTYYLNGALPCNCHFLGSNSNVTCQPYAGQCSCKTGTTGRQCDTCQIQFYGMTDQGCQPCNCMQTAFKACDDFGQCLCPPGVEGATCDRCKDSYYHYDYNRGCTPCDCNNIGSLTLTCNASTGVCTCRPGIVGIRCDQCADNFWQMSYAGCMPCSCDVDGSMGGTPCDKITGQCLCKKNIQSQQCTSCTLNSFSKSVNHVDGCLSCVCMGVTNICSSAFALPRETIFVPLFNASAPAISVVMASLINVTSPITPQVIDGTQMAEVLVQGSQAVYWQAPSLTGDLLNYYEGTISFVAHWVSSDPGAMPLSNVRLLIIGRGKVQVPFAMSVPNVQKNTVTNVNVVLSLENVIAAGQPSFTRGQLLVALTQVQAVLIPATFTTPTHASRIGNLTYSITPENVEQCYCPVGYEGLSCQNCSAGYTRANVTSQGYLGTCITCSCNSHTQLCQPDTGQCINCMDNTAGFNCEVCAEGYYRDSSLGPTSPCNMCPCFAPRVSNASCAIINGSLACLRCNPGYTGVFCDSCLPFYYGSPMILYTGTCSPCTCNGNSVTCDSITGQCLNCSHFTDGFNCEKCMDGWFGNSSSQNCSSCNCNVDGSLSAICNNQTGQCQCVDGVGRRMCDACLDFYYRPSTLPYPLFKGCLPCNCNAFGSANLSCGTDGVCPCKPNTVIGGKCDQCQVGNWGLPDQPCQACSCDTRGTYSAFLTSCEIHGGQCSCYPGVGQRKCDSCLPMYVNLTAGIGCTACGVCETSLGNDTMQLLLTFQNYWNQTLTFQLIQQQDVALGRLESGIRDAMNQTGVASGYDLVTNLTALIQDLQQTAAGSQQNVTLLKSKVDQLAATASQFLNDSTAEYNRVNDIKRQADTVRVDTGAQYIAVQNYLTILSGYNTTAYQLLQTVQGRPSQGTWNYTGLFDMEYLQTQDELARAQGTLSVVQQFNNTVGDQSNRATGLQKTLQDILSSFTSLNSAIAALNANINSFTMKMNQVILKNNQTLANKKTADDLWALAQATIAATAAILNQGQASLAAGQQMVADCQAIINGVPFGALPINTTADLTGITSWTQAYNLVLQQLQALTLTLNNYTQLVDQTERKANSLNQQARSIVLMFQGVQSRGQPAVDAINGFEKVVLLLDQALQMALDANNTMQRTLSQLQSVSISSIEASANQSLAISQAIKQSVDALVANVSTLALNSQLDQANMTLQSAIQKWAGVDLRIATFNAALIGLQNVASNVSITTDLNAGNAACDAALQRLADVTNQNNGLQLTVASQASAIANLASDAANMTMTQIQLRANLDALRIQQNSALAAITSINASEREILSLQPDLTKRFQDLLAKLALVQSRMGALEQPVSFTGTSFETITNPDSGISRGYNSIGLDFIPSYLKGVLFFAENDQTREKVLIQLVNSSIVFEYSNVDVTNTAISPASIEVGVWYRVYCTRYAYDGQLTVIRMATGGTAVTPMRTVSTFNTQLILNSPLYFGGLLRTTNNLPKVYDSGIPFSGCIYNIVFNGAPIPLWQNILRKDSKATCCRRPTPIPSASTISPCVTLYGFGFIKYQPRNTFSVATQAQVAVQFRTFGPDGVILMVSSPATNDYYSIYLTSGMVGFAVSASGNVVSVQTAITNPYNDGQWYQLKATHSPSNIQLVVTRMNQTLPSNPELVSQPSGVNLASLAGLGFTIGGQNPDVSRGPVSTSFAGCLQDFQHSNALTGSFDLQPDTLTSGVNSSAAVDLTKCYASVISGLGFLTTSSYASLRSVPTPINTMSFELVTSVPSGVLFYSQLLTQSQSGSYFYISLYNGDIFIVFNQGQGTEPSVFRSRGNYLGDSMVHKISLDFSFTNSPRMKIDASETHVGAVTMTPYFNLYDSSIYVGGVPPAVGIDSIFCPVRISLVGGIRNLQINGGAINFFNQNYLTGNNVQGIYLSGLPTPPSVLPPLPYTTLSPPATTLPPSCLLPLPFTFLNASYLSFAGNTESYVAYSIASLSSILENAFSIRLSFRALQANGILLYIAGSSATPAYYFSIYLYGGRLRASMMTNTSAIQTKNLQSLYTYDDGNWHEVEVLRVNDFLAVIVAENKDYINNQISSFQPSTITFGPTVYLGGVPRSLPGGYPFDLGNIAVGMKSFQGCISNVSIIQYNLFATLLGPTQEQTRQNVVPCQGKITSGMYLNNTVGYVRVGDSLNVAPTFNLVTGFVLNMTFRSATQAGTLMTAWSSSSRFVALVLSLGQVQVLINSDGQMFSGTSRALPSALTVCDGQPHVVVFTIGNNFVTLQVDSYAAETVPFGTSFSYMAPLSIPIYLGGVRDPSWNVPGIFSGNTFQGCLQSISINGVSYFITESPDVLSALSGCPI